MNEWKPNVSGIIRLCKYNKQTNNRNKATHTHSLTHLQTYKQRVGIWRSLLMADDVNGAAFGPSPVFYNISQTFSLFHPCALAARWWCMRWNIALWCVNSLHAEKAMLIHSLTLSLSLSLCVCLSLFPIFSRFHSLSPSFRTFATFQHVRWFRLNNCV